ncbi:MAG: TIGR02921 family PEP-CTERM protein [Leptolyngbyaceae cyanobacterium bins.59]|nr:TIGR02921 family PEP-CTERM protein [Leptolyngbyaceae cyanobacterium bins.59]
MKRFLAIVSHIVFWVWNLSFLTFVYAGILPYVGAALVKEWLEGSVPTDLLVTLTVMVAVPTVTTLLGLLRFRKQPLNLLRLFYGVEVPLFMACLLRMFLLRELTPATVQILGTIGVCVAVFLTELLFGYAARRPILAVLQLVGHSLMVWVGVFTGIVFAFYAIPAGWALTVAFFKFEWVDGLVRNIETSLLYGIWWMPFSLLLFVLSACLFVALPFALGIFYYQSWQRVLLAFAGEYGRLRTWAGTVSVVFAWLLGFVLLQQQPQIPAFQALAALPNTDVQRRELLAKSDPIRKGLVNAYLLPYRYLSTRQENNHIQMMYESVFNLPRPAAEFLQHFYNQLMSPFLYDGDRTDQEKAATLYAEFFDTPIQKGEREAINRALEATYNRGEAKAGLLNVNQEYVWLRKQQVTVTEQGDWADIELYEIYENFSPENLDEEAFYSFSLPENAVITGLWLGNSADRNQRYPFAVSPRGAAQEVYNNQVQRQVDPALIEQVGPRHYRLRAFPIPAWRDRQKPRPQFHLWMTYKVLQQDGTWPLPQLGERRNVYWNDKTKRVVNGREVSKSGDDWLPASIPAARKQAPAIHDVAFSEGFMVMAKPLQERDYVLPQGKRFAIVLDGSRSMGTHAKDLKATFDWLKQKGLKQNDGDLYLTTAPGMLPKRIDEFDRFDVSRATFYGTVQLQQMVQQFSQLQNQTSYDAILLVTDEGSYELADDKQKLPALNAPLWMVHVGGKLPPAYDDSTLDAIQGTGGGVATDAKEVLQRMATRKALGPSVINVMDDYVWLMTKRENPAPVKQSGFDPIAARQLILGVSQQAGKKPDLVALDAMHTIAKSYKIVTPYSSMLVLVNDQQREELKKAEARKDRFDREVEKGSENLSNPLQPMTVSGVPEPEEWLLMIVGAIGLVVAVRTRHRWARR